MEQATKTCTHSFSLLKCGHVFFQNAVSKRSTGDVHRNWLRFSRGSGVKVYINTPSLRSHPPKELGATAQLPACSKQDYFTGLGWDLRDLLSVDTGYTPKALQQQEALRSSIWLSTALGPRESQLWFQKHTPGGLHFPFQGKNGVGGKGGSP